MEGGALERERPELDTGPEHAHRDVGGVDCMVADGRDWIL